MLLQIADILSPAETAALREALAPADLWRDGAATAAGRARAAKNNLQADPAAPAAKGALEMISRRVLAHETVAAAARPVRLARLLLSRYEAGMAYGAHVDAAYIDGARTDVSFTLFLAEPESYDGGELVIETAGAEDRIKLPAGAMALYPSTALHRVAPVTKGARLAAVGWFTSRVKSAERRAMLFELETVMADLAKAGAPGEIRDRLANLRNNLLRDFGD